MRLAKTDMIAGLDATTVRDLMRSLRNPGTLQFVQSRIPRGVAAASAVAELKNLGYLQLEDGTAHAGEDWWVTRTLGNALAMASFAKPISRATAERLLAGLLERTKAWNANPDRLVSIDEVIVFGSYLDPTIDRLGDVDIAVTLSNWPEHQPHEIFNKRVRAYSRASGRTFPSFVDELLWPEKEAVQHLRNRSTALRITTEDIRNLTDKIRVVYTR